VDFELLALVWFVLVGILLTGYAILDGFDLGVGMLHLLVAREDRDRRLVLASIGPLWDGNEVWLVAFGGALFAAFPAAYAAMLSGFYTVLMLTLFALVFRAVSIEFRSKIGSGRWRSFWDGCFAAGSFFATFLFGVAVGNLMRGVPLDAAGRYAGSLIDQLNPYALVVGALTVTLFAMHGAIFLYLRTEGELQQRLHRWMWRTFGLFLIAYMLTTMYTLVDVPRAVANLRANPLLWGVPVLSVLAIANIPRAVFKGNAPYAFVSSSATIAGLLFLLGVALYPDIVPSHPGPEHSLAIVDAASSPRTLGLMLGLAAVGMPLVLAYTATLYWTFRGKVRLEEEGYGS